MLDFILVTPTKPEQSEIHMFVSGGKMFDTQKQPTSPIFTIHEDSSVWHKAIEANAEHASD